MYDIIKQVINSGDFELEKMLETIKVNRVREDITAEQETELIALAREKADPTNSYSGVQKRIDEMAIQLNSVTTLLQEHEKQITAIKTAIEEGGTIVPEPKPNPEPEEFPDWKQPSGAHDAYNTGDKMTYTDGKKYICKMDGCVWGPDVYPAAWEEVTDETTLL